MRSRHAIAALLLSVLAAGTAEAQDAGARPALLPDAGPTVAPAEVDPTPPAQTADGDRSTSVPDAGIADAGSIDSGLDAADAGVTVTVTSATATDGGGSPELDGGAPALVAGGVDDPMGGVPLLQPIDVSDGGQSFVDELLPFFAGHRWTLARLLFLLLALAILTWIARRLREVLPDGGVLPRTLRLLHIGFRLGVFLVGMAIAAAIVEPAFGSAFPWVLLAVAAAIGWSLRDVLPDLSAFVVLVFERRVRCGVWISGESFAGVVERRGLRAVWLRDGMGHRIAVPNRLLLGAPVLSQLDEGPVHDVTLRFMSGHSAARERRALSDAVLTSPWARADGRTVIRRDGSQPELWHVRAELIDLRFAMQFEGDLLERAEDILDEQTSRKPIDDDWD